MRTACMLWGNVKGGRGTDGREVELSVSGGYIVWRYVGGISWTNMFAVPADGLPGAPGTDGTNGTNGADGVTPHIGINGNWYIESTDTGTKAAGTDGSNGIDGTNGTNGADGKGITSIVLTSTVGLVKTYTITFTDATTFQYTVTNGTNGTNGIQGAAGTNGTNGTNGLDGGTAFQVHFEFTAAGALTYICPYALVFTAMIRQQANAPTLSTALNANMAQYQVQTVTADAAGLVTLTGTWL